MIEPTVVLEARDLVKKYGDRTAINKVSFKVNSGECFGFLGPLGSGKSSLMRMAYGGVSISSGDLYVLGLNVKKQVREIKVRAGILTEDNNLDTDFSVLENLIVFANYFSIDRQTAYTRARELIRFMQLEDYVEDQVQKLSLGMKRRLAIARSLINSPQLLILDEPTAGLDFQSKKWIWDRLDDLKEMGTSLVIATSQLEDVERLCDKVAILDRGKIVCEGVPADLVGAHAGAEVVEFFCEPKDLQYFVSRVKTNYDYQVLDSSIRLYIKYEQDAKSLVQLLPSDQLLVRKSSLEDVFLKLTGSRLR